MIGILGGTFDPIHNGHLFMATKIAALEDMSEIKLIPCKEPVHKNLAFASTEQRIEMLRLAIANHPKLTLDLREINRTTPSFMVDTLMSLRKEYPKRTLVLILGMDSFLSLPKWHAWQSLLIYTHILVVSRPNISFEWSQQIKDLIVKHYVASFEKLSEKLCGEICFYSLNSIDISATEIRNLFLEGKDASSYLPKSVFDYIIENKIYINSCIN